MTIPAEILPWVQATFVKADGSVNSAGHLLTYLAGTSTPSVTFTTSDLDPGTPNPVDIELGIDGRPPAPIYLSNDHGYKLVLTDSDDVVLWTYDDVESSAAVFLNTFGQQMAQGSKAVTSGYEVTNDDFLVTVDEPSVNPAIITLQLSADRGGIITIQNVSTTIPVSIQPVSPETINAISAGFTLPVALTTQKATSVILVPDGVSGYYTLGGCFLS